MSNRQDSCHINQWLIVSAHSDFAAQPGTCTRYQKYFVHGQPEIRCPEWSLSTSARLHRQQPWKPESICEARWKCIIGSRTHTTRTPQTPAQTPHRLRRRPPHDLPKIVKYYMFCLRPRTTNGWLQQPQCLSNRSSR